jgi:uncharacterized protein (TIGR02246 family)
MRENSPRYFLPFAVAISLGLAAAPSHAAGPSGLTADDRAKIESVLRAYRAGWLANDAQAVLRLFTEDAVLMPHHGVKPVVGKAAARAFWFPSSGPPTTVTLFDQAIDEINGVPDLAYVRGRSKVEWTTGTGADAKKSGNAGTNLTLLRRQPDGSWRIAVQMWDDPPNQLR